MAKELRGGIGDSPALNRDWLQLPQMPRVEASRNGKLHPQQKPADIRRTIILAAVRKLFGRKNRHISILPDENSIRVVCTEQNGEETERLDVLISDDEMTVVQGPRGAAAPAIEEVLREANADADREIEVKRMRGM